MFFFFFWFYNKTNGIIIFFIKKNHFTYLYYNVIRRNNRKSHSESFTKFWFFFFWLSDQTYICSSKIRMSFSCQSECTTRSTLILTPDLNSQRLLIRIPTDENLRYIVSFKTFPAMWFDPINVASPINRRQRLYCLAVMNTRHFEL